MKTITAAALLLAASTMSAAAQVGVNTIAPDSSALLDIRYSGAGKAVGVLLPDLNATERASKKGAVSKGMVVFDRAEGLLYYHDGSQWVAANPLASVHTGSGFSDIRPQNAALNQQNMSLGLPPGEAATAKLDVNGSARVRQTLKVDGSDTVAGNATVRQNLQVDENLQVGGSGSFAANVKVAGADSVNRLVANSSVVNGNSEVTGTLTAGTLAGYGTIPVGGIIMWSGANPPNGWALCTGQTVNGQATPDLQGRFIVGYQPSDADYSSIGNAGGEKTHTLTVDEMPSHSHEMWLQHTGKRFTGSGDANALNESNLADGTPTGYTGGGNAHENRPPYYVLALIMRVQ
jgi:microcystin-dependent protein